MVKALGGMACDVRAGMELWFLRRYI
jgi:hypothetical protein